MKYQAFWKRIWLALTVLLFALSLVACGTNGELMDGGEATEPAEEPLATEAALAPTETTTVVNADVVIGWEIHNLADEQIAEISEVLFNQDGEIQYVILDVDDMIAEMPAYAVDWDTFAFSMSDDPLAPDVLMYDGEAIDLDNAIGLEEALLEPDDVFYETAADLGVETEMLDGLYQMSAFADFDLFDYDLVNRESEDDMGEIEELLVDVHTGTVSYVIADIGGWLGVGENAVIIPWDRLSFNADTENFVIDADQEALTNAPTVDTGELVEVDDEPDWVQEIESFWDSVTTVD